MVVNINGLIRNLRVNLDVKLRLPRNLRAKTRNLPEKVSKNHHNNIH